MLSVLINSKRNVLTALSQNGYEYFLSIMSVN
jgi:hypothetical protein